MKVLTTLSYYKPYISGLTICVQRLIEGLSKKDFEFTVLTSRHKKELSKSGTDKKINIIRLPVLFTLGKVPIMPWYLFQAIREIKNNDLVWVNLPQAEGLIAAIVAKLFRKKIITTVHCLPLLPSGWQRLLFQKLFDLLNNLVVWLSDKVVYYTKDYAENTKELLHICSKSSYILPPVIPVKTAINHQPLTINHSFTVGFAGRIAEDKGLEYLLESLSLLKSENKNVELIIAGNRNAVGESAYVKKINNRLKNIKYKVRFMGEIDSENMFKFYRKINLLVLPSVNRTEAFGIVQAEAMLSGIPVVASDLPGVRIPIQLTGSGQLFPAGNAMALAEVIGEILARRWDQQDIIKRVNLHFQLQESLLSYERILQ